jgi:hypothetical protein
MPIFIKKKKGNLTPLGFAGKRVSGLTRILEKQKSAIASRLNKRINRYSHIQKKTGLVLFCVFFGSLFVYQLGRSFNSHLFTGLTPVITHLRSSSTDPKEFTLSDSLLSKAKRTRQWLDSLQSHDSAAFKVILLSKPLLLKTIRQTESLYPPQTK